MTHWVRRLTPGLLWGLLAWACVALAWTFEPTASLLGKLERDLYDMRLRARDGRVNAGPRVVVVAITRQDERIAGPLPWPRERYARLLDALDQLGCGPVLLDLNLSAPGTPEGNAALAASMERAGKILLPVFSLQVRSADDADRRHIYRGNILGSATPLRRAAFGVGHVNVLVDDDGIVRRLPLLVGPVGSTEFFTPAVLHVAQYHLGLANASVSLGERWMRVSSLTLPTDGHGALPLPMMRFNRDVYIHDRRAPDFVKAASRRKPLALLSYHEVIAMSETPDKYAAEQLLRGRPVVVGAMLQGSEQDIQNTPFGRQYGILVQAAFLANILARDGVVIPTRASVLGTYLLLSCVLGLLAFTLQPRASLFAFLGGTLLVLGLAQAGFLYGAIWLFRDSSLMPPLVPGIVLLALHPLACLTVNTVRERQRSERTQRVASAALHQSEERLRTITENLPVGIVLIDRKERVLAANPRMGEWFPTLYAGHPLTCRDLCLKPEAERSPPGTSCDCACRKVLDDGQTRQISVTLPGAEGERNYQATLCPVRDADGHVTGVIRMMEDVTERLVMQRHLEQAGRFEAANTLAAGVAHEINNPLNTIQLSLTGIEMLLDANRDMDRDMLRKRLRQASGEVEQITKILKHMRSLVRRDTRGTSERVEVNETIRHALRLIGSQLEQHGIEPRLDLADGLPPVHAHPLELEQVVVNIVVNAMHALDETEGDEKYILLRTRSDEAGVLLHIEDNGPGLGGSGSRVFDPFFSTKEVGKGMGLGLALVRTFVNNWGGRISATTGEAGGARFDIVLPPYHEESDSEESGPCES